MAVNGTYLFDDALVSGDDIDMYQQIYSIGHSNHKWEIFLELLKQNGIELLVDTRSKPVSSYAPFANIRVLPGLLEDEGIDYLFMGDSLGGKPTSRSC